MGLSVDVLIEIAVGHVKRFTSALKKMKHFHLCIELVVRDSQLMWDTSAAIIPKKASIVDFKRDSATFMQMLQVLKY